MKEPNRTSFLIFGESANDCSAVAHLVRAILPEDYNCCVRTFRKPLVLSRAAAGPRRSMAAEIAAVAQSYEDTGYHAVAVAHRDCDDVEPAHERESASLEAELRAAGVSYAVTATPAWEIEAWWMLFPGAVAVVRPCWRALNYGAQNVGSISNAKERLARDLRPEDATKRKRCKEFEESDGIRIAEEIKNNRKHLASRKPSSKFFEKFYTGIRESVGIKGK